MKWALLLCLEQQGLSNKAIYIQSKSDRLTVIACMIWKQKNGSQINQIIENWFFFQMNLFASGSIGRKWDFIPATEAWRLVISFSWTDREIYISPLLSMVSSTITLCLSGRRMFSIVLFPTSPGLTEQQVSTQDKDAINFLICSCIFCKVISLIKPELITTELANGTIQTLWLNNYCNFLVYAAACAVSRCNTVFEMQSIFDSKARPVICLTSCSEKVILLTPTC